MKTFTIKANEHQEIELTKPGQYTIKLAGPGAELNLISTLQTKGKIKTDLEITIHHQAPHTRAKTTMKGVARDQSHLRFKGKIIIDENCGDSQSFLTQRILLLSPQAKAEAIPDLEIKTDDVSCSHAMSIANISEDHLFYLMSRGLDRTKAEEIIIKGFLAYLSIN
ncbi:MAG: SufD family Fe-S cluster assembly protein [Candidatus Paceibacterota bacterium]